MTTLTELAAMLDAATGPSRELDGDIAQALGWRVDMSWQTNAGVSSPIIFDWQCCSRSPLPDFTSSIDAASALRQRMLPDWEWSVWRVGETCGATVYNTPEDEIEPSISSHAPTAPLAILKATVAALIAKEDGHG